MTGLQPSLDLSRQTATRLTQLAHAHDAADRPGDGRREVGVGPGRRPGQTPPGRHHRPREFSEVAENYSLGRLYGLLDRLRHVTPADEQDLFEYRYLVIQPSLDESVFKLWGQLPGIDGRIIEKALSATGSRTPGPPPTKGRDSDEPTL